MNSDVASEEEETNNAMKAELLVHLETGDWECQLSPNVPIKSYVHD